MITLSNIHKSFGTNVKQLVLNNLYLEVEPEKIHTIMGPSGSGKTTLLKILGTLLKPDSGEYMFNQQIPFSLNELDLAEFRNQKIGFVFQNHMLLPQCNVLENILIPTLSKKNNFAAETRAKELMRLLEIKKLATKFPHEISGGEAQRTAIARALINVPSLLLADEPTGALDSSLSSQFKALLKTINAEQKTTMVIVTHSNDLANGLGNIYKLSGGQLIR